jgi:hypothetical protein
MDIDKQEDKTTEADACTSHNHDSVSHDVPVPTSESVPDKQKVEPIGTDTVDASHECPSMSYDSDVATATLPPADHSGMPDSNEADSPGSSPPHLSPQGGDGGGGMGDVYTKRGYTSEIFKIELSNLPKKLSFTVSKIA